MAKKSDITLTELRSLIKDFYPNLSMKEFNALTKGGMEARKADKAVRKIGKAKGDLNMPMQKKKKSKMMNRGGATKKSKMMNKGGAMKKTKYMSKGGMKKTKYMSKGGMKKTKYMSRGGAARRK